MTSFNLPPSKFLYNTLLFPRFVTHKKILSIIDKGGRRRRTDLLSGDRKKNLLWTPSLPPSSPSLLLPSSSSLTFKESQLSTRSFAVVEDFAKHLDLDKTLNTNQSKWEIYSAWISGERRKKEMMIHEKNKMKRGRRRGRTIRDIYKSSDCRGKV